MPFALYEAGGEDETFILVAVENRAERIEDRLQERTKKRFDQDIGPIQERRVVPKEDSDFPLHASLDKLHELIRENRELFPNGPRR